MLMDKYKILKKSYLVYVQFMFTCTRNTYECSWPKSLGTLVTENYNIVIMSTKINPKYRQHIHLDDLLIVFIKQVCTVVFYRH